MQKFVFWLNVCALVVAVLSFVGLPLAAAAVFTAVDFETGTGNVKTWWEGTMKFLVDVSPWFYPKIAIGFSMLYSGFLIFYGAYLSFRDKRLQTKEAAVAEQETAAGKSVTAAETKAEKAIDAAKDQAQKDVDAAKLEAAGLLEVANMKEQAVREAIAKLRVGLTRGEGLVPESVFLKVGQFHTQIDGGLRNYTGLNLKIVSLHAGSVVTGHTTTLATDIAFNLNPKTTDFAHGSAAAFWAQSKDLHTALAVYAVESGSPVVIAGLMDITAVVEATDENGTEKITVNIHYVSAYIFGEAKAA